eukprot:COSAG01_NODE_1674_length_9542_cov_35.944827_2_plen_133_part_00
MMPALAVPSVQKDASQMATTRKSDRVYATANGIAEAALDGTVNMYMPGTDGGEGHVWAVDSSTMNGIRQNLLSVGQICKQIGYCMFPEAIACSHKYVPPPMRKILPEGWEGFIRYRADVGAIIAGSYESRSI